MKLGEILLQEEVITQTQLDEALLLQREQIEFCGESFYPALRLHDVLRKEPDSENLKDGILIVLENHGSNICLFVDEILGHQQTVIKGLSDCIGNPPGISGCTILGDGEVCPILDVGGLIDIADSQHDAAAMMH